MIEFLTVTMRGPLSLAGSSRELITTHSFCPTISISVECKYVLPKLAVAEPPVTRKTWIFHIGSYAQLRRSRELTIHLLVLVINIVATSMQVSSIVKVWKLFNKTRNTIGGNLLSFVVHSSINDDLRVELYGTGLP